MSNSIYNSLLRKEAKLAVVGLGMLDFQLH